jgi:hypothetical protein
MFVFVGSFLRGFCLPAALLSEGPLLADGCSFSTGDRLPGVCKPSVLVIHACWLKYSIHLLSSGASVVPEELLKSSGNNRRS